MSLINIQHISYNPYLFLLGSISIAVNGVALWMSCGCLSGGLHGFRGRCMWLGLRVASLPLCVSLRIGTAMPSLQSDGCGTFRIGILLKRKKAKITMFMLSY